MRLISKMCVISAACLVGFGCGEKEEEEKKSDLEGTWTLACGTNDAADKEEKEYDTSVHKFTGDKFEMTSSSFSDAGCTTGTMNFRISGTFTVGDAVATPAGAKAMDITSTSAAVTLLSDDIVGYFNGTEGGTATCGGGWVKGTEKVLTKELCAGSEGFSDMFEPQFSIFKIDGSNVYFGDDVDGATADGKTAATRHDTLETRPSVKS